LQFKSNVTGVKFSQKKYIIKIKIFKRLITQL